VLRLRSIGLRLLETLDVRAILNRLALLVAFAYSRLQGQGAIWDCGDCSWCRAGPGKGPIHPAIRVHRPATATLLGLFTHRTGEYAGSQSSELFGVLTQSEFQFEKNRPQDGLCFGFSSCGHLGTPFADSVVWIEDGH
jgi:hypothetical protein